MQKKLWAMRHSAEHILTQAMINLYPGLKMAMGPATDEGFYFDFDYDKKISEADFPLIEAGMRKIINKDLPFKKRILSIKKARQLFADNSYKQEWLDEIEKKGQQASVYYTGDEFVDLCAGPHAKSTGKIGPFKLLKLAGAYWRGDEKNKMLTRIYGTCFPTQKELDNYLFQIKEAKKADHRIIGKKLDLFVIDENIGKGLPLLTPKGATIRKAITDYEYELEEKAGFVHVVTPHIGRSEIYKKTGHLQHYREYMYESFGIEGEEYVLKPMNCPHHYAIYASRPRSYKELPIRIAEAGTCYRFEKSGELSGLVRVRSLTIDDAHILLSENQIEQEYNLCINMVHSMFSAFHLKDYYVRVSLADPVDEIKYIADRKTWKKASDKLIKIVQKNNIKYKVEEREASFYGPKLDYMVKDSLGRQWQMSTLQLDLFMARRLNLTYIDCHGRQKHPVIIHRGLTGSLERTIGILIEHFSGAFPLWLSPLQLIIIPVGKRHLDKAQKHREDFSQSAIRVEVDDRNETVETKIRDATLQKIPYMGIIGDKESKNLISVRNRKGENLGQIVIKDFISKLRQEIEEKTT